MYAYVEMQRAKRGFRVIVILLGIVLLVAIALRLWSIGNRTPSDWAGRIEHSPSAHSTTQRLADGTVRTTVSDPEKRVHAVIQRHGNAVRIDVTQPASGDRGPGTMSFGHVALHQYSEPHGMEHITLTYVPMAFTIPIGVFFLATLPFGWIISTLLGCALAKENEGHLELAWTKPVSREGYALGAMFVDVGAIVLTTAAAAVVYAAALLLFFRPSFSIESHTWSQIALAFLEPVAWYALLTAFSASIKRGMGMVVGFGWFAAMVIPSVAAALVRAPQGIAQAFFTVFHGLSYIDPLAYTMQASGHGVRSAALLPNFGGAAAAEALLAIGYLVFAVLQWRRIEA